MLLYDDVVAHRQPKPGAFPRGLGREERIEHLFPNVVGDSGAVVVNQDFDGLAEIFLGVVQDWLKGLPLLRLALGDGVEAVGDQVEQRPRNFLRVQLSCTRFGV